MSGKPGSKVGCLQLVESYGRSGPKMAWDGLRSGESVLCSWRFRCLEADEAWKPVQTGWGIWSRVGVVSGRQCDQA